MQQVHHQLVGTLASMQQVHHKLVGTLASMRKVHDWHAAAASMLYWEAYNKTGGLWRPRMVMTIHNLDNSGECRQDEFSFTGMPGEPYAHVRVFGDGVCVAALWSASRLNSAEQIKKASDEWTLPAL
eukprot:scaffold135571_cov22-Tisochrysis_lutea.AAC.1